jgi:hypothetical protein
MKKISIILFTIVLAQLSFAQQSLQLMDSVKNEMYCINKVFDSSTYLAFDIDITYKSDSGNITKDTEQMSGTYAINKHNLYYQIGSTIFLQTDSFVYNIDPEQHQMIMTKNFIEDNSNAFPLRNFVDSFVHYYGNNYNISMSKIEMDTLEFVKRIKFDRIAIPNSAPLGTDPAEGMQYNYFYIDYNHGKEIGYFKPTKFEFSFNEPAQNVFVDSLGNSIITSSYIATKTVTMTFSKYRGISNRDIFNDSKYVFYNRQRKVYEPAVAYSNYQLITSGFDNEDEDAEFYREAPVREN